MMRNSFCADAPASRSLYWGEHGQNRWFPRIVAASRPPPPLTALLRVLAGLAVPFNAENFTALPIPLPGEQPYVALTAGEVHVCGLLANGTVVCFGDNSAGQLGTLSPWYSSDTPWTAVPSPVYGEGAYVALSARANGTCALLANGTAHCWVRRSLHPAARVSAPHCCIQTSRRAPQVALRQAPMFPGHSCPTKPFSELPSAALFFASLNDPQATPTVAGGCLVYYANACLLYGNR